MPNIIAKKININLDTMKQKIHFLNPKDFSYILGDSIEITVNITENAMPKSLVDAKLRLIGVKSSGEYFEQIEDLTIENSAEGVIKIYPKPQNLNVIGRVILGLIVEDDNETINIQRFGFEVADSMANVIISESEESIQTLVKLNSLLDKYEADLDIISNKTDDLKIEVDSKMQGIAEDFEALEDLIVRDISELNDRINGVDNTIKYKLTKTIKLDLHKVNGSNFHYFKTDVINEPAKSLLKRQYVVAMGGSVDVGTVNSSISLLSFYSQNNKIMPYVVNISDRLIGGRNINASCVYNNLSSELNPNDTGFNLYIKSNLGITLNTEDNIYCHLTPLSSVF